MKLSKTYEKKFETFQDFNHRVFGVRCAHRRIAFTFILLGRGLSNKKGPNLNGAKFGLLSLKFGAKN